MSSKIYRGNEKLMKTMKEEYLKQCRRN